MDFLKSATGQGEQKPEGGQQPQQQKEESGSSGGGGFMSGLSDKFNSAAGGGKESEKNEDYLDKGKSSKPWTSSLLLSNVLPRSTCFLRHRHTQHYSPSPTLLFARPHISRSVCCI